MLLRGVRRLLHLSQLLSTLRWRRVALPSLHIELSIRQGTDEGVAGRDMRMRRRQTRPNLRVGVEITAIHICIAAL